MAARLGADRVPSILSMVTTDWPLSSKLVMAFRHSSSSRRAVIIAAARPVAIIPITSVNKLAPVPACGLSIMTSGVGQSIIGLSIGVNIVATALAPLASPSKGKSQTVSMTNSTAALTSLSVGLSGISGTDKFGEG